MKLSEMTWEEVKGRETAVIPVGSVEQHGPHLPLETDTLIAEAVSRKIASKINAVVISSIRYGVSAEHMDFPGTISLTKEIFAGKVTDICNSLLKHGFKKIILVNGHGGNSRTLGSLKLRNVVYVNIIKQIKGYDHAGEIETSLMFFLHPEKIRSGKIKKHDFKFPGKGEWRTIDYSKSGVLGDPTKATAEKGQKYFEQIVSGLLNELKDEVD
jgi:creatinine amidohydrolase